MEDLGVEKVVVNLLVEDIDLLKIMCCLYVDVIILYNKIFVFY